MIYWANIDWEATGAMLQGWGTIGGAIAVYLAATTGLQAWRQQKIAERKRDEVEIIIRTTYNARRALRYIRSPLMTGYEQDNARKILLEKNPGALSCKTESQEQRFIMSYAYFIRLDSFKSERNALEECLPMARALFGPEVEKSLEDIYHQFHVISVDAEAYGDDVMETDRDFALQVRKTLFSTGKDESKEANPISYAIEQSVQLIEQTCIPYLNLENR